MCQDIIREVTLWANGGGNYYLSNSDYNYWTPNDENTNNPGTADLPVKDTDAFTKNTQIIPAVGVRSNDNAGTVSWQGSDGHYWQSTPLSSASGYRFYINRSSVITPTGSISYARGYSIRCVRI
jgi:hypothetical protein